MLFLQKYFSKYLTFDTELIRNTIPCNYNMELAGSHPTVVLILSCWSVSSWCCRESVCRMHRYMEHLWMALLELYIFHPVIKRKRVPNSIAVKNIIYSVYSNDYPTQPNLNIITFVLKQWIGDFLFLGNCLLYVCVKIFCVWSI